MSFAIGIVGLPNVGKSTLFKALTKKQVDTANYPFCTIDPNIGVVAVPDERLAKLAKVSDSIKIVPTTIEFVDIAGLVAGAHQGEGLGNKFLANIRNTDAIIQVLRDFSDPNVTHVQGQVDPESDKETINLELIFTDLQTVDNRFSKNEKLAKGDKNNVETLRATSLQPILEKLKNGLEAGQLAIEVITNEEEKLLIKDLNLLTLKPMIYVLNVDESYFSLGAKLANDYLPISAKIEAEIADLNPEEAEKFLKELDLDSSGLDKLIKKSYNTLKLITFFTSGREETKAWTVKKGSKAPLAAGVIHTDFEKGFIRAEVINWQDFVNNQGEVKAREKGLMRLEGKDYVIQDGDVCHFRFAS